ncbi:hypothetical protein ACQPZJ_24240 [Actinoplanes sp. CA-054009]
MTHGSDELLAAVLDASIARIGAAAADARYFDRRAVARMADIWDNNTFVLFGALLSSPGPVRRRRAAAALRWMADLGPGRRAWMVEQMGPDRAELLGPPCPESPHYRDHLGRVRPSAVPMRSGYADDYDLARATVRSVRVERAGTALAASVLLAAPRRFAAPAGHRDPRIRLDLEDVRAARLDSTDLAGAALTADGMRLGERGVVRAGSGTVWIDDDAWHLSPAGLDAGAATPAKPVEHVRPPQSTRPPAVEAAMVLREGMLMIRSVRYAHLADRIPLAELRTAFAGAGEGIRRAATRPPWARERAFRHLAEGWLESCPLLAGRMARAFPDGHWIRARARRFAPPTALPERAQLTLAEFDGSSATALLATGDELRVAKFATATRFTLDTSAFAGPHPVAGSLGGTLSLGGALAIA